MDVVQYVGHVMRVAPVVMGSSGPRTLRILPPVIKIVSFDSMHPFFYAMQEYFLVLTN